MDETCVCGHSLDEHDEHLACTAEADDEECLCFYFELDAE